MRINYALLGQAFTVWCMVAFFAAPLIGSYFRKRRANEELKARLNRTYVDLRPHTESFLLDSEAEADRRRDALEGSLYVAYSEINRRQMAKDAVTPITENEWQATARKAEGLGFLEEIEPKRIA